MIWRKGLGTRFFKRNNSLRYLNSALLVVGMMISCTSTNAKDFKLTSHDGVTTVEINIEKNISFSVAKYGKEVLSNVTIDLEVNNKHLGINPVLRSSNSVDVNETLEVAVPTKNKQIQNQYKELELTFKGGFGLHFRLYDDGLAYRFYTKQRGEIEIQNELLELELSKEATSFFPEETSTYSHYERTYVHT